VVPPQHRAGRALGVFQEHEIPQPWSRRSSKCTSSVGGPIIRSVPHHLFGAVVVVVPKRGSHVGLELDCCQQATIHHHHKIPFLFRPVIARSFHPRTPMNGRLADASIHNELADQLGEAIELDSPVTALRAP
jgi:hypothetical protein